MRSIRSSLATTLAIGLALASLIPAITPLSAYAMEVTSDSAASTEAQQPAPEYSGPLKAYAVNVGHHMELRRYQTWVIRSEAEWDALRDSMSQTIWSSDKGSQSIPVEGLTDYPESFFASGMMLAVAYSDLGSGGYQPYLTDVKEDGESLLIRYVIPGLDEDALFTCDMNGFVAIVELPSTSRVEDIVMTDATPSVGASSSSETTLPDTPTTSPATTTTPSQRTKTAVTVRKSLSLEAKATASLGAYANDANGKRIAGAGALTYKTSNAKVATVSKDGKVTAKLPGKATITVSYPGSKTLLPSSAKVSVTVTKRKVAFSKCSASNVTIPFSKVRQGAVTVAPVKAPKTVYARGGVTYAKQSGPASMTVNSKTGKVTIRKGTKKGTHVVVVRVSSKADSCCVAYSQTLRFKVVVR